MSLKFIHDRGNTQENIALGPWFSRAWSDRVAKVRKLLPSRADAREWICTWMSERSNAK